MASISEKYPGYVTLPFSDGDAVVHYSWANAFQELESLCSYLSPDEVGEPDGAHRVALCRPLFRSNTHVPFQGVPPINVRGNPRYAFPKRAKSESALNQEFARVHRYRKYSLPVPFPVGYIVSDALEHHLLTAYEGTDSLATVVERNVLFERVYATSEHALARAALRGKELQLYLLRRHVDALTVQASEMDVCVDFGQEPDSIPERYRDAARAYQSATREADEARVALENTVSRSCVSLESSAEERSAIIKNAARALRKFSDAGLFLHDIPARHFIVKDDLDVLVVDFEHVEEGPPLTKTHRRAQFKRFLRCNRPEMGRLSESEQDLFENEYVA